ncbi:uncharacterized protein [Channa argus]|uniref:uncharacterized protein n=1 Tax=Channa argus TaxID=215402 RepID=UPI00352146B9
MKTLSVLLTLCTILTLSQAVPLNSTVLKFGGLCQYKRQQCYSFYLTFCPECDINGNFLPQQCSWTDLDHRHSGECWCVDVITGEKIPNTNTPPGTLSAHCDNSWPCPKGWFNFGERCYTFINTPKKWLEAEIYCQFDDANLASVHSEEENRFIMSLTRGDTQTFPQTWLGGFDVIHPGYWIWSDGTIFNYKNWYDRQPYGKDNNDKDHESHHEDDDHDHHHYENHHEDDDHDDHHYESHHEDDDHHNHESHHEDDEHDNHHHENHHEDDDHHDHHYESHHEDDDHHNHDSHHEDDDKDDHHEKHHEDDDDHYNQHHNYDNHHEDDDKDDHHEKHYEDDDDHYNQHHNYDNHHEDDDKDDHHEKHNEDDDDHYNHHHDNQHEDDNDHDHNSYHDDDDNHKDEKKNCLRINYDYDLKWFYTSCDDSLPFVCSKRAEANI